MLGFQCLKGFFGIKNCYILSTAAFDNGILALSIRYATNVTCFVKRVYYSLLYARFISPATCNCLAFSNGFWTRVIR